MHPNHSTADVPIIDGASLLGIAMQAILEQLTQRRGQFFLQEVEDYQLDTHIWEASITDPDSPGGDCTGIGLKGPREALLDLAAKLGRPPAA